MAATLGATAPVAYVLCAIAMGLIVLCLAEAGSRVSMTGGPYAYIEVAFGPFVGFLAGFLLWMVLTFAMAAVATVLLASLGALVPALSPRWASAAVLIVIYAAFATINILGVGPGARVNNALTVAKILPLVLLVAGGIFAIDPNNLAIVNPPDLPTLARSSILLIFVFAGVEAALVPGGEVKDPVRTVPRAIVMAMVTITVLYASLQFVAQGVLGPALPAAKAAPLAEAAGVALGGWARQVLLIGAVVSMLGHAGGMILATPRMLFAFARDGFFPSTLARLHPTYRTPVAAILLHGRGIYLCEHRDRGGSRSLVATLQGDDEARPPLARAARTGSRFSAKAFAPSCASSEPKSGAAELARLRPALLLRPLLCALHDRLGGLERQRGVAHDRRRPAAGRRRAPAPGSVSRFDDPHLWAARSAPTGSPVRASSIARW